jgi:hypothetical protein
MHLEHISPIFDMGRDCSWLNGFKVLLYLSVFRSENPAFQETKA